MEKQIVEKVDKNTMSVKLMLRDKMEFYELLSKVKSLPGRQYIKDKRTWYVPITETALNSLKGWGFQLSSDLVNNKKKALSPIPSGKQPEKYNELYPFQKKGVEAIDDFGGKILIADEMGLGKTIQALMWLKKHPENRPALIVVPASLKLNWDKEIKSWMSEGEKTEIINGRYNGSVALPEADIYIINYDILFTTIIIDKQETKKIVARPDLMDKKFDTIIIDECHYIKNRKANRTKAVKQITKKANNIIAMSGTPILNKPIEFYPILNILNPSLFPSFWNFAHSFCEPVHNGFGWTFNGATNTEELHNILKEKIMVRNLKKDVLKDLPDKVISVVPFPINNIDTYRKAEDDIISWLRENEGKEKAEKARQAEILVRFEKLKQLAVSGKLKMIENWLDNYLESENKIVLFATHHSTIDHFMEKYKGKIVKLDGRDSKENRDKSVKAFQENPKIKIFIGNIKAAGVGLTLTAANSVAFLELGWTPGEHAQAEDRIHRIGQTAESINIFYLIAAGTIEIDIANIIDEKKKKLDAVLEGKKTEEKSLLLELIKTKL